MLRKMFATTNDVLPLILRLTLGVVMLPHGAQKLLGWFGGYGFSATMKAMKNMPMVEICASVRHTVETFLTGSGLSRPNSWPSRSMRVFTVLRSLAVSDVTSVRTDVSSGTVSPKWKRLRAAGGREFHPVSNGGQRPNRELVASQAARRVKPVFGIVSPD